MCYWWSWIWQFYGRFNYSQYLITWRTCNLNIYTFIDIIIFWTPSNSDGIILGMVKRPKICYLNKNNNFILMDLRMVTMWTLLWESISYHPADLYFEYINFLNIIILWPPVNAYVMSLVLIEITKQCYLNNTYNVLLIDLSMETMWDIFLGSISDNLVELYFKYR